MTKTIKLSLAAAVLATAACAAPKVSGSLAHQFQKKDSVDEGYVLNTKVTLKTTGAVNDNISYAVSYAERAGNQKGLGSGTDKLGVSNAKFTIKTDMATVIAGRQGLTTPWTNGSSLIDGTQVGNGVIALAPVGPVTLVGAYVVGHNIQTDYSGAADVTLVGKSSDIAIVGALGKVGPANVEAWYSSIGEDESAASTAVDNAEAYAEGLTGLTVAASASIEGVNVKARYSQVDPAADIDVANVATLGTQSLMSLEASAKVGDITINGGIAQGGADGNLVSLDAAGNNANQIYAGTWNLSLGSGVEESARLISIGATMPINEMLTANVNYSTKTAEDKDAVNAASEDFDDITEIKAQISANVAKNMSLYFRAAQVSSDNDANDYTRTRLYAAYKF